MPGSACRSPRTLVLQAVALAFSAYLTRAVAAAPHPHQGILRPYQGSPPAIVLSDREYEILERGEPIYKQIELDDATGGRGAVVFRVMAPADVVWSVISDFSRYPQWVEGVDEAEIFRKEGDDIYVRFKVHWLGGRYTYYAHHTYPGAFQGWGTWRLDYSRQSDFDDSVGFWHVTPVSGHPRQSDVVYSAELKLKTWVPDFLKRMVAKRGLKEVTHWLKQQAEARAEAELK